MSDPIRFTLRCWNCGETFSHVTTYEQLTGATMPCHSCGEECRAHLYVSRGSSTGFVEPRPGEVVETQAA